MFGLNRKIISLGILIAFVGISLLLLNNMSFFKKEEHKLYLEFIEYLKNTVDVEDFDFETIGLPNELQWSRGTNLESMQYAFLDINDDGVDELFIGNDDHIYPGYLYSAHSVVNGEIVHIISSKNRYHVYLLNDFTFSCSGSNGYNNSSWESYRYTDGELVTLRECVFRPINEFIPDDCAWYYYNDDNEQIKFTQQNSDMFYEYKADQYDFEYIPFVEK